MSLGRAFAIRPMKLRRFVYESFDWILEQTKTKTPPPYCLTMYIHQKTDIIIIIIISLLDFFFFLLLLLFIVIIIPLPPLPWLTYPKRSLYSEREQKIKWNRREREREKFIKLENGRLRDIKKKKWNKKKITIEGKIMKISSVSGCEDVPSLSSLQTI